MYDALEDEFGDVVGKARRGQEKSTADVAQACGLSPADIDRIEAYQLVPDAPMIDALAACLGLDAAKLRGSAAADFLPREPGGRDLIDLIVEMRVLGTDFLMNGYVIGCRRSKVGAIIDPGYQADRILHAAEALKIWSAL